MRKFNIGTDITIVTNKIISSRHKKFGYGGITVYLRDIPVWFSGVESDPQPVKWNWIGLVSFFTSNWSWLFSEQSYPLQIHRPYMYLPSDYSKLRMFAFDKDILSEDDYQNESVLKSFFSRHNLSEAVPGIDLPPIFMLRSGNTCVVTSGKNQVIVGINEIYTLLSDVVSEVISWIDIDNNQLGEVLINRWNQRDAIAKDTISSNLNLLLNMTIEEVADITNNDSEYWELSWTGPLFQESDIFAAARMSSGYVTLEQQKNILNIIKRCELISATQLDNATQFISWKHKGDGSHKQGYVIAAKLREFLRVDNDQPINPDDLLSKWGIPIVEVAMPNSSIEAIACWGKNHGPLIILNRGEGKKGSHINGRMFTLAHEICHLLVDRNSTLDVCEVLGGGTLALFEKRANAFAAEILFPCELAARLLRKATVPVSELIETWRTDYHVTKENIARQILNHESDGIILSSSDRDYLVSIIQ